MSINHEAIRRVYPNVVTVDDDFGMFDADGNQLEIDQALVDAAAIEVAAEQALSHLRRQRNQLLAETDWVITMHKELETNIPNAWKTYRQALRDLPANTEDPADPVWPTKPS
jgi:hypothetical protein